MTLDSHSYEVHRHHYGWLIFRSIPIDDLFALIKLWTNDQEQEFIFDMKIAEYFGANVCICKKELSKMWKKELKIE